VTLREPPFLFVFWFVFPATRGRLPIHNTLASHGPSA